MGQVYRDTMRRAPDLTDAGSPFAPRTVLLTVAAIAKPRWRLAVDLCEEVAVSPRIAGRWTAVALSLVVVAVSLVAQQPVANTASVAPGMRVRAWGPAGSAPVTGTLVSNSGSSVRIARERDTVDVQDVTRIQEPNGRHGHALAGVLVGAIGLGAAGAIAGAAATTHCTSFCITSQGEDAAVLGVAGVLSGAVVGGIVGALIHTDRWQDVPLTRTASRINLWLPTTGPHGRRALGASIGIGIG